MELQENLEDKSENQYEIWRSILLPCVHAELFSPSETASSRGPFLQGYNLSITEKGAGNINKFLLIILLCSGWSYTLLNFPIISSSTSIQCCQSRGNELRVK